MSRKKNSDPTTAPKCGRKRAEVSPEPVSDTSESVSRKNNSNGATAPKCGRKKAEILPEPVTDTSELVLRKNGATAPKCGRKKAEISPEPVMDTTESIIDKILAEDGDNQQSTSTSIKRSHNIKETVISRKKNKGTAASSSLYDLLDDDDDLQVSNHEFNGIEDDLNVIEIESVQSPIASPLYSKASTPESFISYHQDALLTMLPRPSSAPEPRSNSTSTNFFHSHEATATSSNSGILNTQNKMVPSPFSKMTT
ncbi:hypothetical protein RCL_jg3979.t1 [Rhizophagus clarus]|uniref:Uncharacterized protein n=1 Tax=Rhizophagus clarus TaxID=94130 RepID=A0A8H3KTC8_9GLOM|nr:hypothetical protein RCL_jg3979.t1 [Rhizophagus clarus]